MIYYTQSILAPGAVQNWPEEESLIYLNCLKKYLNFSVNIEYNRGRLMIEKDGKKYHATENEIRCFEEILNDQTIKRVMSQENVLENIEKN